MQMAIPVSTLTYIGFHLLHEIDSGREDQFPIEEVSKQMENETIFDYLEAKGGHKLTRNISDVQRRGLARCFWSMDNAINTDRKMGVGKSGLCVLVAFILECIQNPDVHEGWIEVVEQESRRM